MRTWKFSKGHGTGNDFVIVLDRHGLEDVGAAEVRYLCDRHFGIGADGLLRVVPARTIDGWDDDPDLWFMDYRNADGSIAQMCGNGARVFARFLLDNDLVNPPRFRIGTRAGVHEVEQRADGFRISMGAVRVGDEVQIEHRGGAWAARAADVGNPHAVVVLGGDEAMPALDGLDLTRQPSWSPQQAFPEGVNIEFVARLGDDRAMMRVHERGVGETLSCGTGTVAVAAVLGHERPEAHRWAIEVRGGLVEVDLGDVAEGARQAWLTGPAEIVARGEAFLPDHARRRHE